MYAIPDLLLSLALTRSTGP